MMYCAPDPCELAVFSRIDTPRDMTLPNTSFCGGQIRDLGLGYVSFASLSSSTVIHMTDTTGTTEIPTTSAVPIGPQLQRSHENVGNLLAKLCDSAPTAQVGTPERADARFENQLALVRLGMATSLFYSLRTKHAPTAAHSLRVALICSAWVQRLQLDEQSRDRIEVAALLHDLGKIGIPDRILRKPGKLTVDEQLTMDCCPELGCEILRGCTSDRELLDIVRYSNAWYDSRRDDDAPHGDALPLGSRLLAIAGAFDAMTTDHVYRAALSRERALQEIIRGSSIQFDPELVVDFCRMLEDQPELLHGAVVDRWLVQLQPESSESLWQSGCGPTGLNETVRRETLFYNQLLENLQDCIAFVDGEGTVTQWNDAMQQLTGIAAEAIFGKSWSSSSLRLREPMADAKDLACPVRESLLQGVAVSRNMLMEQPGAEPTQVHVSVSPVTGNTPGNYGGVIIIRDLSDQANLKERVESLHEQSTLDALTGVANRAHFDQTLKEWTAATASGGPSFSLVICDIDHFKQVNDVHGHPAGDEALVSFASVLSAHSRDGDLVARYGGEEFLLIAANCDNATATKRAEAIRKAVQKTPLPSLGGDAVTASFGVTEFQAGDSPETIVARADRALLKAKDNGRNRVIQLGSGIQDEQQTDAGQRRGLLGWFGANQQSTASEIDIRTPVPADLAIEKLRGFIADHDAEIINVDANQVSLKVIATCTTGGRRRVDHQIALNLQMTLNERVVQRSEQDTRPAMSNTLVKIHVRPIRNRDRRRRELKLCVDQIINSLRSYLMGEILDVRHCEV